MTFRGKLLLAQAPLAVALVVIGAGSLYAGVRFGQAPDAILDENFRSFDAARAMVLVVDDVNQRVLARSLQEEQLDSRAIAAHVADFETQLRLQEGNITEAGEEIATRRLRAAWSSYRDGLNEAVSPGGLRGHRQRSAALRAALDAIVEMNRDAMRRKSDQARREAEEIGGALIATAILAFLGAVVLSALWLGRILAPIQALQRAVRQVSGGDFDARLPIAGNDEIAALSASFNDMAERLAQYRASSVGKLFEAKHRLESVMHSLADAVVVYDLDGEPALRNEVAVRLLGDGAGGFDRLPEALHDVVKDGFDAVRRTGEPFEPASLEAAVEVQARPSPRWILVSATPVRIRGGILSGVTVAFRDVTRARHVEGFKGDLVAAAAHELRTPLTSLHMAIHLCLEQTAGPVTDRQRAVLGAARQDCERIQSVVDELLEMARLESGAARLARTTVDLAELSREAVVRHETAARQRASWLDAVTGVDSLEVEADAGRLEHVLDNLIENALRHAGEGGRIEVGVEPFDGFVRVFVDDAGPGIAEAHRESVFTKFFRVPGTAEEGTGLGLSIVRDIVRAHGGDVGVEASRLGGARFWFSIPTAAGRPAAQEERSGPSAASS